MQQAGRGGRHRGALPLHHHQDSSADGGAAMNAKGFCIYIDTFCQGSVPVVSDETGYIIFETELEAQREIVDHQMTRLRQFLDGEREYEDAIEVEEYVVAV